MSTTKNSKKQANFNAYTRFYDAQKALKSSRPTPYRRESVYLLNTAKIGSKRRRSGHAVTGSARRKSAAPSSKVSVRNRGGGPPTSPRSDTTASQRRNKRAAHIAKEPDHYMVLTEDHTVPAMQFSPQLDAICYDVLQEPKQQLLKLEGSNPPSIRGTRISICVENTRFPLISKISKSMGYQHVPEHRLWNVQWCDVSPHIDMFKTMKRFQQVNHFPGINEICRKDLLSRNLNRMLKMYPGDYRIFPKTWLLPSDSYDVACYASRHRRSYILKPYSAGQGRGIRLATDLRSVGKREKLICQTYIEKPLLIDGYKFDLRVYTLITSVDPLRIFVYNEGLARFATNKYVAPTMDNSHNIYMHLTNYCLNRRNSQYEIGSGDDGGSKRKLSAFNRWLTEHNYDSTEFWASVDDAIIKTVISAWPVLRHNYHLCFPKHDKIQASFQLLGFDILVDWKLKPYILEVNHTPSLSGDETVDQDVKRPLIRDTLNLLSTALVDKDEIIREDRAVLRNRLMRHAWNRRSKTPQPHTDQSEHEVRQACSLGSLAQQIAWEESHLGNYRRVMPPTDSDKVNYYCKFYDQTRPGVMFANTIISRKRERMARQHMDDKKHQEQMHMQRLHSQRSSHRRLPDATTAESQRAVGGKQSPQAAKSTANWIDSKLARMSPALISARALAPSKTMRQSHKVSLRRVAEQEQLGQKERTLISQRAVIAKEILKQKQLLLLQHPGKEKLGIWQSLQKRSDLQESSGKHKGKSRTKSGAGSKKLRRKLRNARIRARRQRLLEMDVQGDADFLAMNAIRQPAGTQPIRIRSPGQSSATLLTSQSTHTPKKQVKPKAKLAKKKRRRPHDGDLKWQPFELQSNNNNATTCPSNRSVTRWMPSPITEKEEQERRDWRRLREEELDGWQFKEKIFEQMYQTGHLSKNDIKKFPELLYGILKTTAEASQNEQAD